MSSTLAFTSEGHMQEKNRGGGNGPAETDKDNFQRFWMILAHERTKHIVNINAVFIYIIYIYIYTYIYIIIYHTANSVICSLLQVPKDQRRLAFVLVCLWGWNAIGNFEAAVILLLEAAHLHHHRKSC